jgi:hypothetical protein
VWLAAHPQCSKIDAALIAGGTQRPIAGQFHIEDLPDAAQEFMLATSLVG